MTATARRSLFFLLLLGGTVRLWVAWTQTYAVFHDETFQYLEPAHRLVFGSGVITWEYYEGIRSWLLPGLVAAVMRLAAAIHDDPRFIIAVIRSCCALLSLTVVWVGFRVGLRRDGLAAAVLTGGLCAIWYDLIWFAPAVMTEALAAYAALLGIMLGKHERHGWAGAWLGLAFCLRYQYAPALLVAALVLNGRDWPRWRAMALGGLAVVLPIGGVLDWITWGAPFHSIWQNVIDNSLRGVSAAIGTEPAWFLPAYLGVSWQPLPVWLVLIGLGARRAPALAAAALVTLLFHAAIPHKEVRFIYLAIAAAPILAGLGAATALRWLGSRHGARAGVAGTVLLAVVMAGSSLAMAVKSPLANRWAFERPGLETFLIANKVPGLCGLAVRDRHFFETGGYSYLHRDIPVFYDDLVPEMHLAGATIPLRFGMVVAGRPMVSAGAAPGRYNAMVAEQGHEPDGFTPVACVPEAGQSTRPPLCLSVSTRGCD